MLDITGPESVFSQDSSYNISTIVEVLERYSRHGMDQETSKLKLPKKQVKISLPEELADDLDPIAMKIGEQFRLYGFRAKINFRNLLKCLACRNGRKAVTEDDFRELLELANFMNFKCSPI